MFSEILMTMMIGAMTFCVVGSIVLLTLQYIADELQYISTLHFWEIAIILAVCFLIGSAVVSMEQIHIFS